MREGVRAEKRDVRSGREKVWKVGQKKRALWRSLKKLTHQVYLKRGQKASDETLGRRVCELLLEDKGSKKSIR
jgi:hypothetical protein